MFVKFNGETHYLWRAVDHEGEVLKSLMASVTAYQIVGIGTDFGAVWLRALLAGLPVAAVMSVLGAFVIKPRMEAFLAS